MVDDAEKLEESYDNSGSGGRKVVKAGSDDEFLEAVKHRIKFGNKDKK